MAYRKNTGKEIRSSDYIVFLTGDTVLLKNRKMDILKSEGFEKPSIKVIEPEKHTDTDPYLLSVFFAGGVILYLIKKYFILNPLLSYIMDMGILFLIIAFPLLLFLSYRRHRENEKEALMKFERVFGNFKKNPVLYNDYLKNYLNGGILIAGIKQGHDKNMPEGKDEERI